MHLWKLIHNIYNRPPIVSKLHVSILNNRTNWI